MLTIGDVNQFQGKLLGVLISLDMRLDDHAIQIMVPLPAMRTTQPVIEAFDSLMSVTILVVNFLGSLDHANTS